MTHAGVDRLRMPRRGPITAAVIRRTEMRSTLDDLARNPDGRIALIVTAGRGATACAVCASQTHIIHLRKAIHPTRKSPHFSGASIAIAHSGPGECAARADQRLWQNRQIAAPSLPNDRIGRS
jgi:hypothetical protein